MRRDVEVEGEAFAAAAFHFELVNVAGELLAGDVPVDFLDEAGFLVAGHHFAGRRHWR